MFSNQSLLFLSTSVTRPQIRMASRSLEELIQTLLENHGVSNIQQITCLPHPDDFNLGTYATSLVKFTNDQADLNLFLKICEVGTFVDQVRATLLTYDKEVVFYSEILPSLTRFEVESCQKSGKQDNQKGSESVADMVVEFYGVGLVGGNTCLVMDKFSEEHHYVKVRDEFHKAHEVECALKHIARFHATSYAMKTCNDIHLPTLFPILNERLFHPNCPQGIQAFFVGSFEGNVKLMSDIIAEVKDGNPVVAQFRSYLRLLDDDMMDRMGDLSANLWPAMCHLATRETHTSVLCHGDFHMGNIAFHKENLNEMKLFDFQAVRYASPLTDVHQYLFQVTTPETRTQCLQQFLTTYRDAFNATCERLGVQSSPTFTEEFVRGEYERVSLWGFLYGFMFILRRFVCSDGWSQLGACSSSWEVVGVVDMLELWDVIKVYFDLLVEARVGNTLERMKHVFETSR